MCTPKVKAQIRYRGIILWIEAEDNHPQSYSISYHAAAYLISVFHCEIIFCSLLTVQTESHSEFLFFISAFLSRDIVLLSLGKEF